MEHKGLLKTFRLRFKKKKYEKEAAPPPADQPVEVS